MPLSENEQRMLEQMERALYEEDPKFATQLKGSDARAFYRKRLAVAAGLFAVGIAALLGGAVVTETVFNWPGVGSLLIESIQRRDYPVVQGCVLLISLTYVVVNLLTDLLYSWIDPRIRLERQ